MKDKPFHFELQDLLIQFIAAFDDVTISRYDKNRSERERLKVRYIHAPKERVLYDIVNKAQNITLPVISVNVTSLTRDENRVFNKIEGFYLPVKRTEESKLTTHIGMPVPVNVSVSMNILASYQSDLDQIVSNFAPYTNPYVVISWKIPTDFGLTDITEIRSKVLWDGNINYEYPIDVDAGAKPRFIATTSFIIEGWLFPEAPQDPIKNIYFINDIFHLRPKLNTLEEDTDLLLSNDYNSLTGIDAETETVSISGVPYVTNLYKMTDKGLIDLNNSTYTLSTDLVRTNSFLILGENLKWTTNVLVSSNNLSLFGNLTGFDYIYYPSLSGFLLSPDNYSILSDTSVSVEIPQLSNIGSLNIALMNFVGFTDTNSISSRINVV